MYQINFNKPINIHFMGIGGISMSGLAKMLHTKKFTITGSDIKKSKITEQLENLGIEILYGQRASNITEKTDCVVFTAAVKSDNPEYMEAQRRNIPLLDRAELLGQIMKQYNNAISISGTHGKTTVTSMVSLILLEGNLDPTINVGGILGNIGSNLRIGDSDCFVVESCEYTNSFLKFYPKHEIILNIEADHLDFFKDLSEIRDSFRKFAMKVPKDGTIVINNEIENYQDIVKDLTCNIITYGIISEENPMVQQMSNGTIVPQLMSNDTIVPQLMSNDTIMPQPDINNYAAANISYNEWGYGSFDLYKGQNFLDHVDLSVIGRHNISNAVAAIALTDTMGVSLEAAKRALLSFKGTERRFEKKGEIAGVTIVDDYAHHPTEISATLTAAKKCPHKKLWCVFQPHTYTRTKSLLPEFAKALSHADCVVLTDIYAAREKDTGNVSSKDLLDELQKLGISSYYYQSFDEIENFLLQSCTKGDLLITMGAGDVYMIGESILGK